MRRSPAVSAAHSGAEQSRTSKRHPTAAESRAHYPGKNTRPPEMCCKRTAREHEVLGPIAHHPHCSKPAPRHWPGSRSRNASRSRPTPPATASPRSLSRVSRRYNRLPFPTCKPEPQTACILDPPLSSSSPEYRKVQCGAPSEDRDRSPVVIEGRVVNELVVEGDGRVFQTWRS